MYSLRLLSKVGMALTLTLVSCSPSVPGTTGETRVASLIQDGPLTATTRQQVLLEVAGQVNARIQAPERASLSGRLLMPTQSTETVGVPNHTIRAFAPDGRELASIATDAQGSYTLSLPTGLRYELLAVDGESNAIARALVDVQGDLNQSQDLTPRSTAIAEVIKMSQKDGKGGLDSLTVAEISENLHRTTPNLLKRLESFWTIQYLTTSLAYNVKQGLESAVIGNSFATKAAFRISQTTDESNNNQAIAAKALAITEAGENLPNCNEAQDTGLNGLKNTEFDPTHTLVLSINALAAAKGDMAALSEMFNQTQALRSTVTKMLESDTALASTVARNDAKAKEETTTDESKPALVTSPLNPPGPCDVKLLTDVILLPEADPLLVALLQTDEPLTPDSIKKVVDKVLKEEEAKINKPMEKPELKLETQTPNFNAGQPVVFTVTYRSPVQTDLPNSIQLSLKGKELDLQVEAKPLTDQAAKGIQGTYQAEVTVPVSTPAPTEALPITAIATWSGEQSALSSAPLSLSMLPSLAPVINILNPSAGTYSYGATLALRAEVLNAPEDAKVEIFSEFQSLKKFDKAPYEFSWDTNSSFRGQQNLRAVLKDASGKTLAESKPAQITLEIHSTGSNNSGPLVAPPIAPQITALSTAAGTVGGKVALVRRKVLTISGTNFDLTKAANNIVNFGVIAVPAQAIVDGQLQVTVPASLTTVGDIIVCVTVNNQNSTGVIATVPAVSLNGNGGFN